MELMDDIHRNVQMAEVVKEVAVFLVPAYDTQTIVKAWDDQWVLYLPYANNNNKHRHP